MDATEGLARAGAGAARGAAVASGRCATWDRNGREPAFLNHRDKRLVEATTLARIDGYRKRLGVVEFDYLAACQEAERLARRRTRRMQALVGVLIAAMVAGLAAWRYEQPLKREIYWF